MGFDPITLGIAAAVISAGGAVAQGAAASSSASYQAEVAKNNQITAEQNAEYATQAGEAQALNEGLKGRAAVGAIKSKQAANGLDVNKGSAVDVRAGAAETGTQDVLTTKSNALLSAYGYKTQAANEGAQASLDEAQASFAPVGAGLSAAGGLLGSASSLSSKWNDSSGGGDFIPGAGSSMGGVSFPNTP